MSGEGLNIRHATEDDFAPLTMLWAEGWDVGHAADAPKALIRLRTAASFHARLRAFGDELFVVGPRGAPTGFFAVKSDHIDQLYVRGDQRGTGLASKLIEAAEGVLRSRGLDTAFLDCAIKNARARAFYRKAGWEERGIEEVSVDTSEGPFSLDVMVFQKAL